MKLTLPEVEILRGSLLEELDTMEYEHSKYNYDSPNKKAVEKLLKCVNIVKERMEDNMHCITKEFHFEMAHVLTNYNGKCGNLHGHSYRLLVTLACLDHDLGIEEKGMVLDFSRVKEMLNDIVDSMDHSFAVNTETDDDFEKDIWHLCKKYNKRLIEFPFRTTAENMSKWIFLKTQKELEKRGLANIVKVKSIQLYETASGSATYQEGERY